MGKYAIDCFITIKYVVNNHLQNKCGHWTKCCQTSWPLRKTRRGFCSGENARKQGRQTGATGGAVRTSWRTGTETKLRKEKRFSKAKGTSVRTVGKGSNQQAGAHACSWKGYRY